MRSRPLWNALKVIGVARIMRPSRLRRPVTICQRRDRAYKKARLANERYAARLPRSIAR